MSESKVKSEAEELEYDENLEEDQYYNSLEKAVIQSGKDSQAVIGFIGSIVFIVTIIAVIICFIKFKWLLGFSILFLGIVLGFIIISISKIIEILTINTSKTIAIEYLLEELAEKDIVNIVVDPNFPKPNRETRRRK